MMQGWNAAYFIRDAESQFCLTECKQYHTLDQQMAILLFIYSLKRNNALGWAFFNLLCRLHV